MAKDEWGQRKVCAWTWYEDTNRPETTMFYGENDDEYLSWIWEIPITPTSLRLSILQSSIVWLLVTELRSGIATGRKFSGTSESS